MTTSDFGARSEADVMFEAEVPGEWTGFLTHGEWKRAAAMLDAFRDTLMKRRGETDWD